ncbi:esterase-like activity of phytase family protein [Xylanibacter muris]|nr:esterase-like activity of phytase family protein [Xylanibacter muris]
MNDRLNVYMMACLTMLLLAGRPLLAQGNDLRVVRNNAQRSFSSSVPAGNYSGITPLGGNLYAVVSDKSPHDGFFVFDIAVDSVTGKLKSVGDRGFVYALAHNGDTLPNRDQEGIVYLPHSNTLFISGEKDNRILEYRLDGSVTGRSLAVPPVYSGAGSDYGFESLTYDSCNRCFWTVTESTLPVDGSRATPQNPVRNRLRLQCFNDSLQPCGWCYYEMEPPLAKKRPSMYAMGVSELCALGDGRMLVLEREIFVSKRKLGSFVNCRLFVVSPYSVLQAQDSSVKAVSKKELVSFRTRISLTGLSFANYEGMCLGPLLADGSRVIILLSDSQNRYKGVLRDWFKTIVVR